MSAIVPAIQLPFMLRTDTVWQEDELFADTNFPDTLNVTWELTTFCILGLLCGVRATCAKLLVGVCLLLPLSLAFLGQLLASLFVVCVSKVQVARRSLVKNGRSRYIVTGSVAAVVATITFLAAFLQKSDRSVINELFSAHAAVA